MHVYRDMTRRAAVSALASLALAATGLGALATPSPAAPSTAPSSRGAAPAAISLYAPPELEAYAEGGRVYPALGIRVVAQASDVEVWSHRTAYDEPITSEVRTASGTTALPAGSLKDFSAIDGFIVLDVRRAGSSKTLVHRKVDACLSSTGERVQPEAAATSPYPRYCPYNPYTLGSVMGVQKGWASNIFESTGLRPLPLKAGRYVVESRIARKFWPAFGLTEATAGATTRLTVVDGCPDCTRSNNHPDATENGHAHGRAPGTRPTAASSGRVAGPVPDLRSLPAFGIELNAKHTTLRFSATVWNAGNSPLVIDGFRRS